MLKNAPVYSGEIEADLEDAVGVGQRADGNVIDAGVAICSDVVEGNAATGLGAHASRATNFHSRFRGSGRHIIQKNQLRADVDCLGDLLKGVALDLHGKIWELLADGSKRGGQR